MALILLSSSLAVFAQGSSFELENEIDEILLKKDLSEAIEEAEKSAQNDLKSLYKRLILYRRAVNFEKISPIVRLISQTAREDKSGFAGGYTVEEILKDPLFQDAETLRIYLQNSYYLSEEVFKKFTSVCQKDKTACDVADFDNWLAQKVLENRDKEHSYEEFFNYRLRWRESFGLDNRELLNQFAVDFRNNPGNLDAALRYLSRFNNLQTVAEIEEKFSSKQAADYHVLGEGLVSNARYSVQGEDDKKAKIQTGIRFLEKSLQIPFNEKDKELIWKYYLSKISMPPVIGNYEKQLRFWTKTRLAEGYREAGEAGKAQPIVEELVRLDKSDILEQDVGYLAGAVQAQSGARVVEKKILSEQENRKNTPEYWRERADYYRGRNEMLLVLEAYYEGLKNIPFRSNEMLQDRALLVDWLARFTENEFGSYAERAKGKDEKDLSDETKQKFALWKKTESFLRNEFQATKSNLFYSYFLIQIIGITDFKDLLNEIFNRQSDQIVKIYREIPADFLNMNLANDFLENKTVSAAKKEDFVNQLFNIALADEPEKSLKIIGYINQDRENFVARSIPVLLKNLEQIEENLKRKNLSFTQREDLEYLAKDYQSVLFSAYLKAKNWKGAEKFMREKYDWSEKSSSERHESLKRLAVAAAENGDYADAVRLWKTHANLNRRDLSALSSLARYSAVAESLRQFYERMKINEPYSPIPEMALQELGKN